LEALANLSQALDLLRPYQVLLHQQHHDQS
jgi:hypothetical protein